nr:hypothetical protein [uncultured Lachnoclostridium sp.]
MEKLFDLLPKRDQKRNLVVYFYIHDYSEAILAGKIKTDCVFTHLAKQFGFCRTGVRSILQRAGVFESAANPVIRNADFLKNLCLPENIEDYE